MIGEQQVIQSVRVTNSNDFMITDRFDGVPYEFAPGKPQTIPLDAALHIFGWHPGADEEHLFAHTQRRFGWNTPTMVAQGIDRKLFGKIKIEPVVYQLVEVRPDRDEGEADTQIEVKRPGRRNKLEEAVRDAERRNAG